jgi:hypothetical protein
MLQTKTIALQKPQIIFLAKFAAILTVATLAPLFHFQPITGPVVNAALFLAAALLGWQAGTALGVLPSLIAWTAGLLPSPMLPFLPFIMAGNGILVMVFCSLKEKNYWLSMLAASALKFLFLFFSSQTLFSILAKGPVLKQMILMMSWPQLITAVEGGIIAYFALKIITKKSFPIEQQNNLR